MTPFNNQNRCRGAACLIRAFALSIFIIAFGFTIESTSAFAQLPNPLTTTQQSEVPTTEKAPERSLAEWRADVEVRRKDVEAKVAAAKQEQKEPSAALKRQQEVLGRIDLSLAQLAGEQDKAKSLEEDRSKAKQALDQLVQEGLSEDTPTTFQELDRVREQLRTEKARLDRAIEKESAAIAAQKKALEDLKEKEAERLLTKEKVDDSRDDTQRDAFGIKLAATIEQSELSKAVAQLRRQEVDNAKVAREAQQLQVERLQELESRLQTVVKFGPEELDSLFEELDGQEDDLKNKISNFESAAAPRLRYVEDQWMRARREFDSAEGDKSVLQEKIKAFEHEYQLLKKTPPLLSLQLDLLARNRTIWKYRQRVFNGRPDPKTVLTWTEETTDELAQNRRDERKAVFEIDELREQINSVEKQQQKLADEPVAQEAITKQLTNLNRLLKSEEDTLASIRASIWLHERLLSELKSDSLATTAKDQLQNLWNGVKAVWNYPLTTVTENGSDEVVTVQKVVTAVLVLLAGIFLSHILSRALGRQVLRRLEIDPSASATIQSLFYYVLLLMFGLFALNVAKVPLTAFTVLGGAVALGIGFGSQNIINNFISGLIMHAERPVKVGDLIQLDTTNSETIYGNVEHIGARSTRVRTGSNLEIIVPNSSFLQSNVINFTLSNDKVRTMVDVGVIYGSPTVTVTQLLRRAVIETGRVAKDPPPIILFKSFADSALLFEVHFWIRMRSMMDQLQIQSAVRFRIDQLFREEGITIAFPQRDLHLDTTSPLAIQMVDNSSNSFSGTSSS